MPLFSVIVPVYKVEEYLNQCVDSVLEQNFKDIEIILVDDGSPDSCPEICDEYSEKYDCVKVLHKKNGGLSDARNAGIEVAVGEYLIFLDSDDYWEGKYCLKDVINSINNYNPDAIIYCLKNYISESEKFIAVNTEYDYDLISKGDRDTVLKYLFENRKFPGVAWRVVVKRELVMSKNIRFINGIVGEDYDWLFNVFFKAKSFGAVSTPFYIYRKYRSGSITVTADIKNIDGILFTLDKWIKILEDKSFNSIRTYIYGHFAYMLFTTFVTAGKLTKEDRKAVIKRYENYTFLLTYARGIKAKVFKIILRTFGMNIAIRFASAQNSLKRKLSR